MDSPITLVIFAVAASLAGLAAVLVFALTIDAGRRLTHGVLHWLPYPFLATAAVTTFTAGRSFEGGNLVAESGAVASAGAGMWVTRLASVFLLAAAGERMLSWITNPNHVLDGRRRALLAMFVVFWLSATLSPQLLGAHPVFSHETVYPLILGFALILLSDRELAWLGEHARNACLLFVAASVLLIAVRPRLALDPLYAGFLRGVPRFSGLAPHAVAMASITQVGLLTLWHQPFRRWWLNLIFIALGFTSLLLAQSKTVWVASLLCFMLLAALRPAKRRGALGAAGRQGSKTGTGQGPREGTEPAAARALWVRRRLGWMLASLVVLGLLAFSAKGALKGLLSASQLHELSTLTGRDLIWSVAINEWLRHPLFGYGVEMFNEQYRAMIGLAAAMHAHNQLLDALARSGVVGGFGVLLFMLCTFGFSLKHAWIDGGYALALWLLLMIRCVSEVPISMFGYGLEVLAPMLLIGALCCRPGEPAISTRPVKRQPLARRPNLAARARPGASPAAARTPWVRP